MINIRDRGLSYTLTLNASLHLLVGENSDKDLFMGMTLWIVHQANVSAGVHELCRGSDVQCSVVNPTGILHFACRLQDLKKNKSENPFQTLLFLM